MDPITLTKYTCDSSDCTESFFTAHKPLFCPFCCQANSQWGSTWFGQNSPPPTVELTRPARHASEFIGVAMCGNMDMTGKELRDIVVKVYGQSVSDELAAYFKR